jgi:hypothetical protein
VDVNCIYPDTPIVLGEKRAQQRQMVSVKYWATRTDGSIFPAPFVCGATNINDFSSRTAMEESGWIFGGWARNDREVFVRLPSEPDYAICNGATVLDEALCARSNAGASKSTLSFTLSGEGVATIAFGNGALQGDSASGMVRAFVNGTLLRTLSWGNSLTASITFADGDVLEFEAQDGGIIILYPIEFECPDNAAVPSAGRRLLQDTDSPSASPTAALSASPTATSSGAPTVDPTTSLSPALPCTEFVDLLLRNADTVGSCGAMLASGETCNQTPFDRCSPSSCTNGVFRPGRCVKPLYMTVELGFHKDANFFLQKLGIDLEEGKGALLTIEVTGVAGKEGPACTEDPRVYAYTVERIGLNGVCEISTTGECTLFQTIVASPLDDFDLYCGYENAWELGVFFENRGFYAVTPCFLVLFIDMACGFLLLCAVFALRVFVVRDAYFRKYGPIDGVDMYRMDTFVELGLCEGGVVFLTAFAILPLVGFPLYWVVTSDDNTFTHSYRVADLEGDDGEDDSALFYTVMVSMETETRFIRQRFWDMGIRTTTWTAVGLLLFICLVGKRPVYHTACIRLSLCLVVASNGLWLAVYLLVEDSSQFEGSWVFNQESFLQLAVMLGVSVLSITSLQILQACEMEDTAQRRYRLVTSAEDGYKSNILPLQDAQDHDDDDGDIRNTNTSGQECLWPVTYSDEQVDPLLLLHSLPEKDEPEFHNLRYTACTAGKPGDFWLNGYQLRVAQLHRPVEVLICITSYNEEASEFERTLLGINRNISHLTEVEHADAWQKVAVVIIADGRSKVNTNTLRLLRVQGEYSRVQMEATSARIPTDFLRGYYQRRNMDDGMVNEIIRGHQESGTTASFFQGLLDESTNDGVQAWPGYIRDQEKTMLQRLSVKHANPSTYATVHLFERSLQMVEDTNHEVYYQPLQTIFAMKERNGGKLDSHNWFFNAFAEHLQAKFCVLLDVGTIPQDRAIYKLYRAMCLDPTVGGCCGEISVHHRLSFLHSFRSSFFPSCIYCSFLPSPPPPPSLLLSPRFLPSFLSFSKFPSFISFL